MLVERFCFWAFGSSPVPIAMRLLVSVLPRFVARGAFCRDVNLCGFKRLIHPAQILSYFLHRALTTELTGIRINW